MVELKHRFLPYHFLQLTPVAIANLINSVNQVLVILSRKVLTLELIVQLRSKYQLKTRAMEMTAFLFYQSLPLISLIQHFFSSLDLLHVLFLVSQLINTAPKCILVGSDLLCILGLNHCLNLIN